MSTTVGLLRQGGLTRLPIVYRVTMPDSPAGRAWVVDQSIALTIPLVIVAIMGYSLNVPAIVRFEQFLESILPGSNAFISRFLGPQFALILTLVFFYSYFVSFCRRRGKRWAWH